MKAITYKCLWLVAIFFYKDSFSQRLIPRLGLTGSWISYSNFYNKDIRPGYSANLGYEIVLKGKLHLQPDIGFVTKGSDYSLGINGSRSLTIYYTEVSLPAKYFLGRASKISVLFGPTLGIGVGGRLRIKEYNDSFKIKFNGVPVDGYDIANQSYLDNRLDFGLQVGAGIELWKKVILDIRYTHGFTRLYNDFTLRGDFYNEPYKNARNRSFQFTVGVPFKVGNARK